jgi:hypothetical protein
MFHLHLRCAQPSSHSPAVQLPDICQLMYQRSVVQTPLIPLQISSCLIGGKLDQPGDFLNSLTPRGIRRSNKFAQPCNRSRSSSKFLVNLMALVPLAANKCKRSFVNFRKRCVRELVSSLTAKMRFSSIVCPAEAQGAKVGTSATSESSMAGLASGTPFIEWTRKNSLILELIRAFSLNHEHYRANHCRRHLPPEAGRPT